MAAWTGQYWALSFLASALKLARGGATFFFMHHIPTDQKSSKKAVAHDQSLAWTKASSAQRTVSAARRPPIQPQAETVAFSPTTLLFHHRITAVLVTVNEFNDMFINHGGLFHNKLRTHHASRAFFLTRTELCFATVFEQNTPTHTVRDVGDFFRSLTKLCPAAHHPLRRTSPRTSHVDLFLRAHLKQTCRQSINLKKRCCWLLVAPRPSRRRLVFYSHRPSRHVGVLTLEPSLQHDRAITKKNAWWCLVSPHISFSLPPQSHWTHRTRINPVKHQLKICRWCLPRNAP